MSNKNIYTLSQLSRSIEKIIDQYCNKVVWIKAEIVKLNYYPQSGHCYPTLVEKTNGKVIAEMQGNIWSSTFLSINSKFKSVLKEELRDDMTVVLQGSVTYHPVHGLGLNILDIDPEYTLGELAKERAQTIERLKADQLFDCNQKTFLPVLPKTLAIISVETSKGYQDFLNVIQTNSFGFEFHFLLFPAILQGERAVGTISRQLKKIEAYAHIFDAVAIIRGGGGEIGLSCFDNHSLARNIARFPIPVLTGIGHSTNETVCEMVSYRSFITPTKMAEFLLEKFQKFSLPVHQAGEQIEKEANWILRNTKSSLGESARLFRSLTHRTFDRNRSALEQMTSSLSKESLTLLDSQKKEITAFENDLFLRAKIFLNEAVQIIHVTKEKLRLLSPDNVLKRGYSITRQDGKAIRDPREIDPNRLLETEIYKGKILSRVEQLKNKNHE